MRQIAIGIDIGGTRTKIGIVDLAEGVVVEMMLTPTEKNDADLFINNIYGQYCSLAENAGISKDSIAGIGIGAPGFVYDDGSVDSTFGFLPFMDRHYPLKREIEVKFGLPCRVDNDARIVALGESVYGRGKGYDRVLVLTLGTGLGIGLIVKGKFESGLPYAHLGGHITVASGDVKCYCGRYGCLEALVSATAIVEAARQSGLFMKNPGIAATAEAVFTSSKAGNRIAGEIVSDFLRHLSTGISNYISLFAPDIIIIGGGVSRELDPYLRNIRQLVYLPPYSTYKFEIELSQLDELSGILGSAALFIQ